MNVLEALVKLIKHLAEAQGRLNAIAHLHLRDGHQAVIRMDQRILR